MKSKKLLYLLAVLCTALTMMLPAVALSQAPDDQAPPVVRQSSWGQIKVLYRGSRDSNEVASPFGVQKPGAGTFGGTYADQQWWRSMSQTSRNMAVLYAAYDNYFYRASLDNQSPYAPLSGGHTCKTWVQQVVVPNASRRVASVPANNGSCAWYSNCYVAAWGGGIRNVGQGMIIQTRWGSGLHTAIVYSRGPDGMYWIDCNWALDSRIRIHYVSFSTFNWKSGGCYTIYQITGC